MSKSIKLSVIFLVLMMPIITYSQIGIGTVKPTQELEIAGSIRLLDLESNSPNLVRQLKSDDSGNLVAQANDPERYYLKNMISKSIENPVTVKVTETLDLNIELTVDAEPNSETLVVLSYNIPMVMYRGGGHLKYPLIGGVKLFSSKSGNLVGGNRSFTFANSYGSASPYKIGTFIEGKYVDVIQNNTNSVQTITYRLKGYITGVNDAEVVIFGDVVSGNEEKDKLSYGVGSFSCNIFSKNL